MSHLDCTGELVVFTLELSLPENVSHEYMSILIDSRGAADGT